MNLLTHAALLLAVFLGFGSSLRTQYASQADLTASGSTCGASSTRAIANNTWQALAFDGTNASTMGVSSSSSNGAWFANVAGLHSFCVMIAAYVSGTVVPSMNVSTTSALFDLDQGGSFMSLAFSPSDTTIVASWTSTTPLISGIVCGEKNGIDNGIAPSSTSHLAIVTGLSPNTQYSCQAQSGSNASPAQKVTTLAAAVRTPISSAAFGKPVIPAPTGDGGDYPFTFVSNDGNEYIVQDDGYGFASSPNSGANMQIGIINPSKMVGTNIDLLSAYGGFDSYSESDCPGGGSMTNKQQGLFGVAGDLYIMALRICSESSHMPILMYGNAIKSVDHATSWNNYTATGTFNANGNPPAHDSYQFANANIGSVNPIRYAADDSTLGYLTTGNRIDGADGFVYMTFKLAADASNEYLMRQPRIYFEKQSTNGIAYWAGSTCSSTSFVKDSNWSSSPSGATAIYSVRDGNAYIGEVTFIPGVNGYLFLNTFAPNRTDSFTVFNFFYGPEPCGPWTQITQQANAPTGYYSPSVLHSSVLGNHSTSDVRINFLYSGNRGTAYWFHNQPLTLNPGTLSDQQLVWYGCNTNENLVRDGGGFSTFNGYGSIQPVSGNLCGPSSTRSGSFAVYKGPPVAGDIGAPWPADQCSEVALTRVDSAGYLGPGVRMNARAGTGYAALFNGSGGGVIYKFTGSDRLEQIGTISSAMSSGDVVKLCVSGTTFIAYDNGSPVGTAMDASYDSGNPGWEQYGSTSVADAEIGEWDAIANQAAAPSFSTVTSGYFGSVAITSASSGANIYYTTDGSRPTRSSSSVKNGGSVTVNGSETLKAMAAVPDYADSQVTTVSY